ncbi:MAG: BRCT domain-containing protein, partial [Burkholderiales bacterium]
VGDVVARVVALYFGSLLALMQAEWPALTLETAEIQKRNARARTRGEALQPVPLEGIGIEIMQSLQAFLAEAHNLEVIQRLLAAGVEPAGSSGSAATDGLRAGVDADPDPDPVVLPLGGKTFVVTGTLTGMSRTEVEDWIRQQGGAASGSVSRRTDFLVAGDNAGSKLERARELGVPVIDLPTLLSMGRSA